MHKKINAPVFRSVFFIKEYERLECGKDINTETKHKESYNQMNEFGILMFDLS